MSKRKREEKSAKKTISLVFSGRTSKITWFEGTSGDEIEQHIRKKLQIPASSGELFLLDPSNEDEELVISESLPADGVFNVKVVKSVNVEADHDASTDNKSNFKQGDHHSDVRVKKITPLIPPALLLQELQADEGVLSAVRAARKICTGIVRGEDDRLLVVVGPCSIHDPEAALDYANRLYKLAGELAEDLFIVMRVYFEKPRTTVGWKGLINDPALDGTFNINRGLRLARQLLLDINMMGVPCGCEFLDTISPQYTADLVTWGAIGARTTESQLHRELTSGLSMPVGFKNSTSGSVKIASEAVVSSRHKHCFLSVTTQGLTAIVETNGNPDCHVILRGGEDGPNYDKESVTMALNTLERTKVPYGDIRLVIDCSHGNSRKIHTNQPIVCKNVGQQVAAGNRKIIGVMIESHITAGAQKQVAGKPLVYGQSITDACVDFETTATVLKDLAKHVRARRKT